MSANKQALAAFVGAWDDEDPDEAVFDAYHALCQADQTSANTLVQTLGEAMEAWEPLMHPELAALPCNSVVGARCLQIMLRAEGLIERLHDINGDSIREPVLKQCDVYLFG
jgi:hypothetical protein